MPCSTKLSSNKNAKSNLTLTPDDLDYIYIYIYIYIYLCDFAKGCPLSFRLNTPV